MPLDTGAVTHNLLRSGGTAGGAETPVLADNAGGMMRAARLHLGLSLQDLADATRIKRPYLLAIEEMRIEDLPSRPFTIGYVRSYAHALNLDPDEMVERFKQDTPEEGEDLKPPVGVSRQSDPRIWLAGCGGAVLFVAVVVWNLAQHAGPDAKPRSTAVAESPAPPAPMASSGVVTLSAAQPAPQESTLPTPYKTPGLDGDPNGSKPAAVSSAIDPAAPQLFTPHGAVYGASAQGSAVTLQAKKSVSLVVRTPEGGVEFAQQLKAGEAYRAPLGRELTADVTDPSAINVYVGGRIHTGLTAQLTPLGGLAAAAAGG